MIAPLKINGIDYVGEVVVEQRPNRQGFYLHEVEIKEKLADEFKPPTQGGTHTDCSWGVVKAGKRDFVLVKNRGSYLIKESYILLKNTNETFSSA